MPFAFAVLFVRREASEHTVVVAYFKASACVVPLGESTDEVKNIRHGLAPFLQGTTLDGKFVARRETIGGSEDKQRLFLLRTEGRNIVGVQRANFFQKDLSQEVIAAREYLLALWRQRVDVMRATGGTLGLGGKNESVSLKVNQVPACRHRSDGQVQSGLFNADLAGSLEKD